MQRERADGGVGIRVRPRMRGHGVIDREKLDQLETCLPAPVHQRLQIRKLSHAKARVTAQTKNRYCHARALEGIRGHNDESIVDDGLPVRRDAIVQRPAVALFQAHEPVSHYVIDSVFIKDGKRRVGQIQGRGKKTFARHLAEQNRIIEVPIAHSAVVAHQTNGLVGGEQRRFDFEEVRDDFRCGRFERDVPARQQHILERFRVKRILIETGVIPRIND